MESHSPGVTITELSDDEEPLDLTVKAVEVSAQDEPLDLTVKAEEEPLVATPDSDRSTSPMPVEITKTIDVDAENISITEDTSEELQQEVTYVNIPIQRVLTKQDNVVEDITDVTVIGGAEATKAGEEITKEKSEDQSKKEASPPPVLRKPPTPPSTGKMRKSPPSRSQSLNLEQDKLVKAEAMQFQEALAKKSDSDQPQRWSVHIPIIRGDSKPTVEDKSADSNDNDNTQSNYEDNAQVTKVPEDLVMNNKDMTTSEQPTEIANPSADQPGFVNIPIKMEISEETTNATASDSKDIPTTKQSTVELSKETEAIPTNETTAKNISLNIERDIDNSSSELDKIKHLPVSKTVETGDDVKDSNKAVELSKDATALPIATTNIMEGTANITSNAAVLKSSDIKLKEQVITTQSQRGADQIYLTIHSAKNLPKMDVASANDPYVIIKYGNTQFRSVTKNNTKNPEWNFEVDLKLNKTDKVITITLYDEDKYTKDDIIGEFKLNVDDIIKEETVLNRSAKLSKKGEVIYSATVLKQFSGHRDLELSVDGSVLNIPTSYNLPSGENITIAHAIQFPKGFELESVTTTQNVYKQTLTTKTHIESVAAEIISIDSDKDHKAAVTREIVLPELFETGIKYPVSQYKDAESKFEEKRASDDSSKDKETRKRDEHKQKSVEKSESEKDNPKVTESEKQKPKDSESEMQKTEVSEEAKETEESNTETERKISTAEIKLKKEIEMVLRDDKQTQQTSDQIINEKTKESESEKQTPKETESEGQKPKESESEMQKPMVSQAAKDAEESNTETERKISTAEIKLKKEIEMVLRDDEQTQQTSDQIINEKSKESESEKQKPKESESEINKPKVSQSAKDTEVHNKEAERKISTAENKLKKEIEMVLNGDDQTTQITDQLTKEKTEVSKETSKEADMTALELEVNKDDVSTTNVSTEITAEKLKLKDEIVKTLTETTDDVKADIETQKSKEVMDKSTKSVEETSKEKPTTDEFVKEQQIYEGKAILKVIRAKELEKKDMFNKSDPYVIIKYNDEEFKTAVVKKTLNPNWEQDIELDLSRAHNTIRFVLYDWERIGKDDPLGEVDISISDLVQKTANGPKWYKLQNCKSGSILLSLKLLADTNKNLPKDIKDVPEEVSDDEFVLVSKDEISDKDTYEPPVKTVEPADTAAIETSKDEKTIESKEQKSTDSIEIVEFADNTPSETNDCSKRPTEEKIEQKFTDVIEKEQVNGAPFEITHSPEHVTAEESVEQVKSESPSERTDELVQDTIKQQSIDKEIIKGEPSESKSSVEEVIEKIEIEIPSDNDNSSDSSAQADVVEKEPQKSTSETIEKIEIETNETTVEIASTIEFYPGLSDSVISYPLSKIQDAEKKFAEKNAEEQKNTGIETQKTDGIIPEVYETAANYNISQIQTAEKIHEERKSAVQDTTKEPTENNNEVVTELKTEQDSLLQFIPTDLMNNLPPELAATLRLTIADERSKLVATTTTETTSQVVEEKQAQSKVEEKEKIVEGEQEKLISEIFALVDGLDEPTSKYIYEEMQKILKEEEEKSKRFEALKAEIMKLKEEQNKLLPRLPAELLSSLPQELSAVLQKEMRDAFLNLAQSQTISTTHIETSNASIAASNEKEIVDTISENKEDAKAEKTATSEQEPPKDEKYEELLDLQMEQFSLLDNIPAELLENLPPEIMESIKTEIREGIRSIVSSEHDTLQTTPRPSIKLDIRKASLVEDDDNDDVTLPPTPAARTPYSVILQVPERPHGPTPLDADTYSLDSPAAEEPSVKTELFPEDDNETAINGLQVNRDDYRSVSPDIPTSIANRTIEEAKSKVSHLQDDLEDKSDDETMQTERMKSLSEKRVSFSLAENEIIPQEIQAIVALKQHISQEDSLTETADQDAFKETTTQQRLPPVTEELEIPKSPEKVTASGNIPEDKIEPEKMPTVYITIHSAKDLPKMDVKDYGDPYVVVNHGNDTYKSEIVKNSSNPTWNFAVKLDPKKSRTVNITVMDHDKFTKDDLYGQFDVNLESIILKKEVLRESHELNSGGNIILSASINGPIEGIEEIDIEPEKEKSKSVKLVEPLTQTPEVTPELVNTAAQSVQNIIVEAENIASSIIKTDTEHPTKDEPISPKISVEKTITKDLILAAKETVQNVVSQAETITNVILPSKSTIREDSAEKIETSNSNDNISTKETSIVDDTKSEDDTKVYLIVPSTADIPEKDESSVVSEVTTKEAYDQITSEITDNASLEHSLEFEANTSKILESETDDSSQIPSQSINDSISTVTKDESKPSSVDSSASSSSENSLTNLTSVDKDNSKDASLSIPPQATETEISKGNEQSLTVDDSSIKMPESDNKQAVTETSFEISEIEDESKIYFSEATEPSTVISETSKSLISHTSVSSNISSESGVSTTVSEEESTMPVSKTTVELSHHNVTRDSSFQTSEDLSSVTNDDTKKNDDSETDTIRYESITDTSYKNKTSEIKLIAPTKQLSPELIAAAYKTVETVVQQAETIATKIIATEQVKPSTKAIEEENQETSLASEQSSIEPLSVETSENIIKPAALSPAIVSVAAKTVDNIVSSAESIAASIMTQKPSPEQVSITEKEAQDDKNLSTPQIILSVQNTTATLTKEPPKVQIDEAYDNVHVTPELVTSAKTSVANVVAKAESIAKHIVKPEETLRSDVERKVLPKTQSDQLPSVYFTIHSATNLPKMDINNKQGDPYAIVQHGKDSYKSEIVKNTNNAVWNFNTKLDPNKDSLVNIIILDHDKFTKDDKYGEIELDLKSLVFEGDAIKRYIPLHSGGNVCFSASIQGPVVIKVDSLNMESAPIADDQVPKSDVESSDAPVLSPVGDSDVVKQEPSDHVIEKELPEQVTPGEDSSIPCTDTALIPEVPTLDLQESKSKVDQVDEIKEVLDDLPSDVEEVEFYREGEEEESMLRINMLKDKIRGKTGGTPKSGYQNFYFQSEQSFEKTEEVKTSINEGLINARNQIKTKRVITVQKTIITIVETVSKWLDNVEYKILKVKQISSTQKKKQELQNIKNEIEIIEETVDELVEVTELAIEVFNDETIVTVSTCVHSLQDKFKVVKLFHQKSEEELEGDEEGWDEFLEGIKMVEYLLDDLNKKVDEIKVKDEASESSVEELSELDVSNKGHRNKVSYLLMTGEGLKQSLVDNEIPDSLYDLLDKSRKLESGIAQDKEKYIGLILSKQEYEDTLKEFSDIFAIADSFMVSRISVLNLKHLNEELGRRKKFFLNLSQCLQILNSNKEKLADELKNFYKPDHDEINERGEQILVKGSDHIHQLDTVIGNWSNIIKRHANITNSVEKIKDDLKAFDSVNSNDILNTHALFARNKNILQNYNHDLITLINEFESVRQNVDSPDFKNELETSHRAITTLLMEYNQKLDQIERFLTLWQNYENIVTTLQNWLAFAEDQDLNSESQVQLMKAEYDTHKALEEHANVLFFKAFELLRIEDEDLQRNLHNQLQHRLDNFKIKLENPRDKSSTNIDNIENKLANIRTSIQNMEPTQNGEEMISSISKINYIEEMLKTSADNMEEMSKDSEDIERIGDLTKEIRFLQYSAQQVKQNLQQSLEVFREHEEALKQLNDKIRNVDARADSALQNVDKDFVTVLQTKLVTKDLLIELENVRSLIQLLAANTNTSEATSKLAAMEQSVNIIEEKISLLEVEVQDRERQWKLFLENLQELRRINGMNSFRLELCSAHGHVDLQRIKAALDHIQDLEESHLGVEHQIDLVKESGTRLSQVVDTQNNIEISAQIDTAIVQYNTVCSAFVDAKTRYSSSILLWDRFHLLAAQVRHNILDAEQRLRIIESRLDKWQDLEPIFKELQDVFEDEKREEETIKQLKQITTDICVQLKMEDSGRANFIVEVDDLTHRIVTLRDTITGLFDVLKRRKHDNVDADNVINQSTTTLNEISSAVVQLPTELTSLPTIDLADQLTGIRGHLLRLCQTEAKVAGVRSADRQLSSSREVVPYTRDATAGVMQLWQRVFEDTLNKYNSISTALANQEATGTLVQVWENHLDQVASSLSSPVPGSYQEVLEELRLASLHQSLIMQNQDTLMSLSVPLSSYKPLITRHNSILQQLQLRSEQLMAKQAMWEAYKLNVEKLAVWLREMEKDKLRLSLKHLPLRRLDKMIMRLEELLGKIPTGEIMHRSLLKEQAVLQDNYNNSTLSAVRMELHGLQERLSSLKAGLRTWLDHLNRLKVLSADFESKTEEISGVIIFAQDHVDQPYPELAVNVENDLKTSQDHLNNLEKALTTLNSVSDILEQVHPAVSPADIKQTGSRVWLLQQQRADLHHRIQLRMEELRHAGDISSLLSAQVSNIEAWTNVFNNKIIRKDLPIASVIHRLESDCTQELLQKQEEQQLFDRLHSQLIIPESYNQSESTKSESDQSQAGKTESDQSKKTNLQDSFEECHKLLDHANDGLKERIAYLKEIAAKEKDLLRRTEIEKNWMHKIEAQLAVPIQFKDLYGNGIEDLRKNQKDLEKEINQRSANISSIVQDFEALCGDDGLSVSLLVNSDRAVTQMQTRWSQVCTKSGRRTDHLRLYTNLRTEFLEHNFNIKSYITSANQDLDRLDKLCLDDQQKLLTELESDLEPNLDRVTKLSDTYTLMAKQGMLDNKEETRSSYITIFKDIKTLEDALKEVRRKNVDSLDKYERLSKEVCQSCDILEDSFNGELKRKLEKYEKVKLERNAEIQSIGEVKDTPEPSVTTVEETKQTADSAKPFDPSDEIIQSEVAKPNVSEINTQSEAKMQTTNQSESTAPSTESQSETSSIAVTPAVPEKSTNNSKKSSKDDTEKGDETIEVVDSQIQVDTLRFEEDASVQANTLNLNLLSPNPDSGVFVSASSIGGEVNQVPIDPLLATPEGIPDLPELDDDNRLTAATANVAQSTSTAAKDQASKDVDGPKEDSATKLTDPLPTTSLTYSDVVKKDVSIPPSETENLPKVEIIESVDSSNFVVTASDKAAVGRQSSSNLAAAEQLTVHDSSSLREGSASPISTSCPLCRRQDWKQLEGDLWRLELWLDQATRILNQYLSQGIPSSIEQLEESIQDHREFLLNLDSHKSMALSINVIGSHLAEHSSDSEKADRLVARLAKVNNDWDSVCEKATDWQTRLQKALLENSEFHATIDELLGWLEKTRTIVEEAEPIDLSQNKEVLLDKYNKFLDLKKDLHRCEPRVVSLQEAADQLEIQADAATCREVKIKLNRLSQSLKGLIQVCGIYCCNLARALDLPVLPGESLEASSLYETARVLPALTQQLLEGRSTRAPRSSDDSSEDELNRGVLSRSYRFLGRVVRAALPIQALMLLLLGVSSIVPLERDELICTLQNNLQRSLEPMLRWSNGPPPI